MLSGGGDKHAFRGGGGDKHAFRGGGLLLSWNVNLYEIRTTLCTSLGKNKLGSCKSTC